MTLSEKAASVPPEPLETVLPLPAPRVARKYLVCVLYYGPVDREHDRCIQALKKSPLVADVLELTGCPYIDIGRGIAATKVLDEAQYGGLLFIDHDMVFETKEAELVIESAERTRAVVGAAYSMRRPGHIIGAVDGGQLPPDKKVVFFDGGEVLPANYLGMGMTAIHRSVFEHLVEASERRYTTQKRNLRELRESLSLTARMAESDAASRTAEHQLRILDELTPELRWKDLPRLSTGISDAPCVPFFSLLQLPTPCETGREGNYYGEDVGFCIRNHDHQLPVLLDTRARVYHKGSYCYGLEDVGMQVPYFDRLEVIDKDHPECKPALYSADKEVQEALRESFPDGTLPKPFPESVDPMVGASP